MRVRGILEPLLGTIVLAIALYFGHTLYKNSGHTHRSVSLYKADFDTVDGLNAGTPVKINGVSVGHVVGIELDRENFSAVVSFAIEKDISLAKDTVAAIISESLLGGKILTIIPGSEEQRLLSGSTIYSTQSSMNLEGLLQKFLFGGGDHDKNDHADKKEDVKDDKESEERKDVREKEGEEKQKESEEKKL